MRNLMVAAVLGVSVAAGGVGCDAARSEVGGSPVAKAGPSSRGLMDKYLGQMGDLTVLLKGVKDPAGAQAALPKGVDLTESLKSRESGLSSLPPQEKALLGTEYSGKLASALKGLEGAVEPLQSNPEIAKILGPVLGKIPRFGF